MTIVLSAGESVGEMQTPAGGWYIATVIQAGASGNCTLQQSHDDGTTWLDTNIVFEHGGVLVAAFLTSLQLKYRFSPDVDGWIIDMTSARDEGPADGRLP